MSHCLHSSLKDGVLYTTERYSGEGQKIYSCFAKAIEPKSMRRTFDYTGRKTFLHCMFDLASWLTTAHTFWGQIFIQAGQLAWMVKTTDLLNAVAMALASFVLYHN